MLMSQVQNMLPICLDGPSNRPPGIGPPGSPADAEATERGKVFRGLQGRGHRVLCLARQDHWHVGGGCHCHYHQTREGYGAHDLLGWSWSYKIFVWKTVNLADENKCEHDPEQGSTLAPMGCPDMLTIWMYRVSHPYLYFHLHKYPVNFSKCCKFKYIFSISSRLYHF